MKYLKLFLCVVVFAIYGINVVFAVNFYGEPLNSESVYVVNENTKVPVIEKNVHQKRSPASLTKIMTFIVAYENVGDVANVKVRVRQDVLDLVDPDSSGVRLKADEEISVLDLMHCILICSSGCAANVLADYVGGGDIQNFVDKMNAKAREIECENTNFVNPDGINDENQYTTAFDMYKITEYARNIKLFNNITSMSEYSCFGDERDPIITTNLTMDKKRGGEYFCPYVKGIKTGYTQEAGRCLISYAENGGVNYVGVVMGGHTQDENGKPIEKNMAMIDTKNIYTWIYKNLRVDKIYPKDTPLAETSLKYVWGSDKLLLYPEKDFCSVVPADFKKECVSLKFKIPDSVEAPVEMGDVLGSAEVFYMGERIGELKLVSSKTYRMSLFVRIFEFIKSIILNPVFLTIFIIFLIFLILYLRAFIKKERARRHRAKVKEFRRKMR